jgi:hypothetical protein
LAPLLSALKQTAYFSLFGSFGYKDLESAVKSPLKSSLVKRRLLDSRLPRSKVAGLGYLLLNASQIGSELGFTVDRQAGRTKAAKGASRASALNGLIIDTEIMITLPRSL